MTTPTPSEAPVTVQLTLDDLGRLAQAVSTLGSVGTDDHISVPVGPEAERFTVTVDRHGVIVNTTP